MAVKDNCDGGLFSLMPRSSGWILRAAGSSCTGNTVGMTGARLPSSAWIGNSGIGSRPTCLLERSRTRCVRASV